MAPRTHDPILVIDPDPDVVLSTAPRLDEIHDSVAQREVAVEIVVHGDAVAGS